MSASASVPRARASWTTIVTSLRPGQWTKNLALFAPAIFAGQFRHPWALARTLEGVGVFCLLASAVYLANDVVDRERDRLHPVKRLRPVAAGDLSVVAAVATSGILALVGLLVSYHLGRDFAAVALAYLALQVLYMLVLKSIALLDAFAIALGFVCRVIAGAAVVAAPISNWLYLCTLLLALFLAFAKRRAELVLLAGEAAGHRRILADYTTPLLDQLITVLSACTVLAYALYTVSPETIHKFGSDRLKFTVPFVLFGIFRYLYLVHTQGAGGQPELVLLSDRATHVNLAAYVATVTWAIYW